MGDVFLKNVYSNFDLEKPKIGFATRASPSGTVNDPTKSIYTSIATTTVSASATVSVRPTSTSDSGSNGDSKSAAFSGFAVPVGFVLGGFLLGLVMV